MQNNHFRKVDLQRKIIFELKSGQNSNFNTQSTEKFRVVVYAV